MIEQTLVVETDSEIVEGSNEVTILELLAIQAMMNPTREESDEELFEWSGKFEDL
jgi:hypothetical protein